MGLRTNTPLRAKKPIERIPATGSSTVQPKRAPMKPYRPPVKTQEELDARETVRAGSEGWCEVAVPVVCLGQATNFQHRMNAGQGGPWTASNGLDVCGQGNATGCHSVIHLNQNEAVKNGWTVKSWD